MQSRDDMRVPRSSRILVEDPMALLAFLFILAGLLLAPLFFIGVPRGGWLVVMIVLVTGVLVLAMRIRVIRMLFATGDYVKGRVASCPSSPAPNSLISLATLTYRIRAQEVQVTVSVMRQRRKGAPYLVGEEVDLVVDHRNPQRAFICERFL
jgi:hypothetical protein